VFFWLFFNGNCEIIILQKKTYVKMHTGGPKVAEEWLVYLPSEQPTTCPLCGARTDILSETYSSMIQVTVYFGTSKTDRLSETYLSQVHQCLDPRCRYRFVVEFDEEDEL
jgi:hypothetical protein